MSQQLYRSRSAPLRVNEFIELGNSMTKLASRAFNTPCIAHVVCYTACLDSPGRDMDVNYAPTPQGVAQDNNLRPRTLAHLEDLTAADLQQDGLIQLVIKPLDPRRALPGAFASLSTAGGRDTIWAQIQGSGARGNVLQPLAKAWNRQAALWRSPRLLWGAFRKLIMA